MMTVKQLLPATPQIWAVTPDTPVAEAAALMDAQGIESLLVLDGSALRGLVTSQECVLAGTTQARMLPVRTVMRRNVNPVPPEEPLATCAQRMATARVSHLPVMDAGRPLGIVSLQEVTTALVRRLAEQEFLVTQLENYIAGRRA